MEEGYLSASVGFAMAFSLASGLPVLSSCAAGRPVVFKSNDGLQRVKASPFRYDERTGCNKVRERIWHKGRLVKDGVREVCGPERAEPRYYYE